LGHDPQYTASATRLFEMHDMEFVCKYRDGYRRRLEVLGEFTPVVTQGPEPWIAKNRVYPLAEVIDLLGMDYFQCSISYMVALAILEEYDEVTIAGVDLVSSKFREQRANLEWLIAHAQARGIDVHIPDWSELLRYNPDGGLPGNRPGLCQYPVRYGYDPAVVHEGETEEAMTVELEGTQR
jgi:hypothetical protein